MYDIFNVVTSTPEWVIGLMFFCILCLAFRWLLEEQTSMKYSTVAIALLAGFVFSFLITRTAVATQRPMIASIERWSPLVEFPINDASAGELKSDYRRAIGIALLFNKPIPTREMMDIRDRSEQLAIEQTEKLVRVVNGKG